MIEIILPLEALLDCRVNTTILLLDSNRHSKGEDDVRVIKHIVAHFHDFGWNGLIQKLPNRAHDKKDRSWWDDVRSISNNFDEVEYAKNGLPTVKLHEGTLEFQDGNHRALAAAIAKRQFVKVLLKTQ